MLPIVCNVIVNTPIFILISPGIPDILRGSAKSELNRSFIVELNGLQTEGTCNWVMQSGISSFHRPSQHRESTISETEVFVQCRSLKNSGKLREVQPLSVLHQGLKLLLCLLARPLLLQQQLLQQLPQATRRDQTLQIALLIFKVDSDHVHVKDNNHYVTLLICKAYHVVDQTI